MGLAKLIDPIRGLKPVPRSARGPAVGAGNPTGSVMEQLVCAILQSLGAVTYFKLTKLLYLIDLRATEILGSSLTGEIYLRQQEGPWPPALKATLERLDRWEALVGPRRVEPGPCPRFDLDLESEALDVALDVIERCSDYDNARMKIAAYATKPMKYILRQERIGRDMRNFPVLYDAKTAGDIDADRQREIVAPPEL
jgi:hypothetical protein